MKKIIYYSEELEIFHDDSWVKCNLLDILKDKNKYILSFDKETRKTSEYENNILLIHNYDYEKMIKDSKFERGQNVEFFNESIDAWSEGTIKSCKNDFYIIDYISKKNENKTKILYKNNIRTKAENEQLIKLDIQHVDVYNLQKFECLQNPLKSIKIFLKKLANLFDDNISYIFLNSKFEIFIFNSDNDKNKAYNKEVIQGLMDVAFKHFKEIDKLNSQLFK